MIKLKNLKKLSIKKKYRTDILISEQVKYLEQLENELKLRKLGNKIIDLNEDDPVSFEFLYRITDEEIQILTQKENFLKTDENIELSDLDNLDLLNIYHKNIIRLKVAKKLNIELEYGRKLLGNTIRKQSILNQIRNKCEWYENEIEKILFSNKKINFPMQKKYLEDSDLKIKKIVRPQIKTPEPLIEQEEEKIVELTEEEKEIKAIENLLEKNSTGSTASLFESDHEGSIPATPNLAELLERGYKFSNTNLINGIEKSNETNENEAKKEDKNNEEEYYNVKEIKLKQKSEIIDSVSRNENVSIITDELNSEMQVAQSLCKTSLNQLTAKNKKSKINLTEENVPFWQKQHNRFDNSRYSKILAISQKNSYHRLGIALTDSYVQNEHEIDNKVPTIDNKEKIDDVDIEFLKLADRVENFYKDIYKSANQFSSKVLPNLTPTGSAFKQRMSMISFDLNKSFDSYTMEKLKTNEKSNQKPYFPQPLSMRETPLLLTRINRNVVFPRKSTIYSSTPQPKPEDFSFPPRLVNQHNLREQTKFRLYEPPKKLDLLRSFAFDDNENIRDQLYTIPSISWDQVKPDKSELFHSGLRLEKIRSLLSVNLKSTCFDTRRDAIRHLGLLNVGDNAVIFALNNILNDQNENSLIRFESAKSLLLLGDWSENCCNFFVKHLQTSSFNIKNDILKTIIHSKNSQFTNKELSAFKTLVDILIEFTKAEDEKFSLDSSICIGKLGVRNCHEAINCIIRTIEQDEDWSRKALALESLIHHFDGKDNKTIEYIINQLKYSPAWVARISALKLLSYLGAAIVCRSEHIETIYEILEEKLSEDPIREVRLEVGKTFKDLQLYERVFSRMNKNLESHDETIRSKAVISMEMLGTKRSKVIQTFIDMLELDNSERVRSLIIKALFFLAPFHPKVILAFNSLEKNSKIYRILIKLQEENKMKLIF